jgi:capsid protein
MYRGWSYVDPQKEVAAYKEAELAGYTTKAEIIAQNGGDIEEVFRQRRRELDLADELDLTFDTSNPAEAEPPTVDNIKEELQTEM